ncbi:MAG: hypothetical protein ACPG61_04065 [Paracoccaceae bacterium]
MWATLTTLVMLITAGFTGYYALISLRNPEKAMETATHETQLLPHIMAGRYLVLFLLTVGVLLLGDTKVAAYFLAVCTVLGLYDGWVYWSRGLPHMKHTTSGLLSLGGFAIVMGAWIWGTEA